LTQTPRLAKWAIFLAATALVVYLCAVILRPFVNVIAWAIVLAITFYPVHQYFTRRTGRLALSALMSSVLVIIVFLIPFLFVAGLAINQFIALATSLQQQFTDGTGIAAGDPMARIDAWLPVTSGSTPPPSSHGSGSTRTSSPRSRRSTPSPSPPA